MNWAKALAWGLRITVLAVAFWFGRKWLHGYDQASGALDAAAAIDYLLKLLGLGLALLAVFLYDIVSGVSGRIAGLLFPAVSDVEVRPQYSVAEARVREGRYAEAIEEFRKVWERFPNDVTAHVRIAELLCQHFRRYDEAVRELQAALEKKTGAETWAFVANRLVDVQVEHLHDFAGARETLQRILLKLPGSRYAEAARARVLALNEKEAREKLPPRPPLRVPDRPDET